MSRFQQLLAFAWRFPIRTCQRVDDFVKRRHCTVMEGAVLYPSCRISNSQPPDRIVIGKHSRIYGMLHTAGHGGRIEIGSHSFVSEDTRIWSASSIKIGDRVLISHGVNIHDSDSHSRSAADRAEHFQAICRSGHPKVLKNVPTSAVLIENDAWIGFGATVLKGVTIGEGAIVGAGSMVTKDVAPFTVVVGNPARAIGSSSK